MNIERNTIYKESAALIENAIDGLPDNYKIVYVLKQVSGMEIAEISTVLDVSEREVRARLLKAQEIIKDMLLGMTTKEGVFEFGDYRGDRLFKKVMNRIYELQAEK